MFGIDISPTVDIGNGVDTHIALCKDFSERSALSFCPFFDPGSNGLRIVHAISLKFTINFEKALKFTISCDIMGRRKNGITKYCEFQFEFILTEQRMLVKGYPLFFVCF